MINLAHQKKVYEPIYKKYSIARYMGVAKIPVLIRREAHRIQEEKKQMEC